MANEIQLLGYPAGQTIYAIVRNSSGQVWYETGGDFETWGTGSRSEVDYAITLTDKLGGLYLGNFPSSIPAGTGNDKIYGYKTIVYLQLGAQPASTDNIIGGQYIKWTGTAAVVAADTETGATDLVNWGLLKVGGAKDDAEQIDDIEGSSDFEVKCKLVYQFCRNSVLQSWPYNECREYAELTAATVSEQADWDYVFGLPSDYLMMIAQIDEDDRTVKYEYEVRSGYLFTNDYSNTDDDAAYIEYIKKVTDASEYSPLLQEAIATKFASEMAPTLNPDMTVPLKREFDLICQPDAQALNQLGQYSEDEGSYSWKNARTS
jgi:hypothetical protein